MGSRPWVPLDLLHAESLSSLLTQCGIGPLHPDEFSDLNRAWHRLKPWPDVVHAFPPLAKRAALVSLSNADLAMSANIAQHAGISWHAIMGAEPAKAYKPQAEVFLHALDAMRVRPEEAMMVAAHNHDLHAAARLGLRTALVIRPTEHGPGQTTDLTPSGDWDIVCSDLRQLATVLTSPPQSHMEAIRLATTSDLQGHLSGSNGVIEATETTEHGLPGLGRTNLTRIRLMTIAAVIAAAVALAFDQGYAAGTQAEPGSDEAGAQQFEVQPGLQSPRNTASQTEGQP